jgi:hypothetical protein
MGSGYFAGVRGYSCDSSVTQNSQHIIFDIHGQYNSARLHQKSGITKFNKHRVMTTVNSNLGVDNTDVITVCDQIKHTVHYASKQKFCFAVSYLNTYVIKFLILFVFSL